MTGRSRRHFQVILLIALVVETAVIAWLVLNPSAATPTAAVADVSAWLSGHHVPARLADGVVVEFVLNIAMFVPTGATLRLLIPRVPWWAWTGVGFVVAGAIEATQWLLLDDRSATWSDVWANTIGLGLGAALAALTQAALGALRRRRLTRLAVL